LNKLVDLGFLAKRKNPIYKRDRTNQYIVDIIKVSAKLKEIGYTIPNYNFTIPIISGSTPTISVLTPTISEAIPETTTEITNIEHIHNTDEAQKCACVVSSSDCILD
jgi:hypothetical protein